MEFGLRPAKSREVSRRRKHAGATQDMSAKDLLRDLRSLGVEVSARDGYLDLVFPDEYFGDVQVWFDYDLNAPVPIGDELKAKLAVVVGRPS